MLDTSRASRPSESGGTADRSPRVARHAGLTIGIDASRNRSGGAKAHLIGLLGALDPEAYGIETVHVWSYKALLDALPDAPWLVKHHSPLLERSLFHQLRWQRYQYPCELRELGIDLLLTTAATSICPFEPSVVMSRDMLSFEPGEMSRFGISLARLRLVTIKAAQIASLRRAAGVIFLTRYAANVLQQFTGPLRRVQVIPHGVNDAFRGSIESGPGPRPVSAISKNVRGAEVIRCLYVSNVEMYKHQWHVVRAIAMLRAQGYPVHVQLVGGGTGRAMQRLREVLAVEDPAGTFVEVVDAVRHEEIPRYLHNADVFVFASSCESMPNTLIEAMASGLPIACSDRGPMPEVLRDAGVYFDPEDPSSIARALKRFLDEPTLRREASVRALHLAAEYSWERCAHETWTFLAQIGADCRRASHSSVNY